MSNSALTEVLTMLREGTLDLCAPVEESRPIFEAMFADVPPLAEVEYENCTVSDIDGMWFRPENAAVDQAILYLHGGGYVIGSANSYASTVSALAAATGINIFVPNYRLAPEHPFPAAPDDVLKVYIALLDSVKSLMIAGDSAGGGLVMSLMLSVKEQKIAQPKGALLWSPWLDLACNSSSFEKNRENDPTLDHAGLVACAQHYIGDFTAADARLKPLSADITGLPPIFIQVGSIEVLLDDSTRLAAVAALAGVRVQLDVVPGMPHVFPSFSPMLEESTEALKAAASFLHRCAQH